MQVAERKNDCFCLADVILSCCGQRVADHYRNERRVSFVGRDCVCDRSEERTIASLFRLNYLILPEACGTVNEPRAMSFLVHQNLVGRVSVECRAPGDPLMKVPHFCAEEGVGQS